MLQQSMAQRARAQYLFQLPMNTTYGNKQDTTEARAGLCATFCALGFQAACAEVHQELQRLTLKVQLRIQSDMSSSLMKLYFFLYDRYFTFPFVCPVACPKLSLLWRDASSASQSFPQAGWASVAPFLAKSTAQISKCLVSILLHFMCLCTKPYVWWVNSG